MLKFGIEYHLVIGLRYSELQKKRQNNKTEYRRYLSHPDIVSELDLEN